MSAVERRNDIIKLLCRRRHETVVRLAEEFGVSERTIRRDIEALSLYVPIYTQSGRCGGVYMMDEYKMDRMYMTDSELDVLRKILFVSESGSSLLDSQEQSLLRFLIAQYSKPQVHNAERK